MTRDVPPRFQADAPFPPYTFIPGLTPHPVSDPGGHSYGEAHPHPPPPPLDPDRWADSAEYLRGIDLFNHGYYWEAHEAWEQLWLAAGRQGPVAALLQGLIKLAAAAVKIREGRVIGTRSLAQGARDLFLISAGHVPAPALLGFRYKDLLSFTYLAEQKASDAPDEDPAVRVVYPFALVPSRETDP